MKKVLLVGDAVVPTGFAKMNHAYIDGLQRRGYEVSVIALNYAGDPHTRNFKAYPPHTWTGGDVFGFSRMRELIPQIRPDVIVITNDPWNVGGYKRECGDTQVVASVAVDGKNCRGVELNGCNHVVFWTEFGQTEAKLGGFTGESSVVPLGVDLNVFSPMDQVEARSMLPAECRDAFIVGVVGRNQPRKRIDLAMYYFAEWIREYNRDDAYLFLQIAPTGDQGWDLIQLSKYLGIASRIIIAAAPPRLGMGVTEEQLRKIYSCFDVMLTCTQGEGWGLCHMEAMACRIPQIAPAWAALAEWPEDTIIKVPCSSISCTPGDINVVGGIMDQKLGVQALEFAYSNAVALEDFAERGLALVSRPEFRWENIGDRFADAVDKVFEPRMLAKHEVNT